MAKKYLYLISNDGLHPIIPKLKKQFGDTDSDFFIATSGNVEFGVRFAEYLAKKVRDYLIENSTDAETVYVVWTGLPIYNAVIYNIAKQVLHKEPLFLVWNKESNKYEIFNIDARTLLFSE